MLLLLACSAEPELPPPDDETTGALGVQPAQEQAPDFNYRGADVPLVPDLSDFHDTMHQHGLGPSAAKHAAEVQYKPDVMVAKIAAARTGAELGALFVEARDQDLSILVARSERIRAGLESINDEGPALEKADELLTLLKSDPPRDQLLDQLDEKTPVAIDVLAEHVGEEHVPLILAGAWLQAYDLVALAMEDTGARDAGPLLLRQPLVGDWFTSYTETVGEDFIPSGMLTPLKDSLKKLEAATDHTPMTEQDVSEIRDATESLLGMM